MKFTKTSIENLKPKPGGKYYARADMGTSQKHGFALCVYPSGKKSWFFIYTFDGRRNSLCLGHYPEMDITAANTKFEEQWLIFASGKNPATVKQDKHIERRESPTIKELGKDYLERYAEIHKRSWKEDERFLTVEVYPVWGNRKAQDITKRDVIALLDKVVDRGAPHSADSIFKILRKMFNWAVENDRLNISPCISIKRVSAKTQKKRTLNPTEIKMLWDALDTPASVENAAAITIGVKNAIKLILITAQRPAEVSGMHTREIKDGWWTIPPERSKNGLEHRVPLTELATDLILDTIKAFKKARKISDDVEYTGYIFPTPHRSKDEPIDRHALSKALKNNTTDDLLFGMQPFTPHDLRRTTSTMLAGMHEMDEVINAILNHKKQGIIGVYNLYRYDKEKLKALEAFEKVILKIISPTRRRPHYKINADGTKERITYPESTENLNVVSTDSDKIQPSH